MKTTYAVLALGGTALLGASCAPAFGLSMITPYYAEADMASINEAYSETECAPWGFEHRGTDFFPVTNLTPFRAACGGTVEVVDIFHNYDPGQGVDFYQVNVHIQCDAADPGDPAHLTIYAFEPMSGQQDANTQRGLIPLNVGDTIAQGDPVGQLLTVGAGAHLHFGFYEDSVEACPAPHFTMAATDSITTLIQNTFPYGQMCYFEHEPIPTATISTDGATGDWYGISPMAGDWQGDSSPAYTGDDIRALYMAKDDDNLYLRLDLWENVNYTFGNGPAPNEGRYSFHLPNDGPYPHLYVSVAHDANTTQWSMGYNGSNGPSTPPSLQGPQLVGVSGEVIEVRVPLLDIGSPSVFSRVHAEVVNCCAPGFTVIDRTHCVSEFDAVPASQASSEAIKEMIRFIDTLSLPKGTRVVLLNGLEKALRRLADDRDKAAVNRLSAFGHHVAAQSGKKLDMGMADWLLAESERIIALIRSGQ